MHDMVRWIVDSIIRGKLWDHEPSWGLVVDNVRAKRCGEHVIQSPTNKAEDTSVCQIPHWLLCWRMGEPVCHDW